VTFPAAGVTADAPVRLAAAAMGTRFELLLHVEPGTDGVAIGEAALEEIGHWHRLLTRFAPDSLLSHINRTAAREAVRLDARLYGLFEDALAVHVLSLGAFDITLGSRMAALGFAPSASQDGDAANAGAGGMRQVQLDPAARSIRFRSSGVSLDLGGIAKGHAIDCAVEVLRGHGVTRALLHGGTSSVAAVGAPPGQPGWKVALASVPGAPHVMLRDTTLNVSRVMSQVASGGDVAAGHILDPRTGLGAADATVAVLGASARLGDAWATAMAVLGERPAGLGDEWTTCIFRPGREPAWAGRAATQGG
jgi:FAD:protein FMN transferase